MAQLKELSFFLTYSFYNRRNEGYHKQPMARRCAIEPARRYCYILNKEITVCINYPDYIDSRRKGHEGEIYCENIIECYRKGVKCRHSGISQLYPDPFVPQHNPSATNE